MDPSQRADYLYQEYARLSDKAEEQIKSCIEDFKVLGVIGATIVLWKPITQMIVLTNFKIDYSNILFLGFLTLLLIFFTVLFWNMLKQFYIVYYVSALRGYEEEIRKALNETDDSQVFRFNIEKETKPFFRSYLLVFSAFFVVLTIPVAFIPFAILLHVNSFWYGFSYLIAFLMMFSSYLYVLRKSTKHYFKRLNSLCSSEVQINQHEDINSLKGAKKTK
jgi:hypothetical protein